MAAIFNVKGTSVSTFQIGKGGKYIGSDGTEGMYISSDGTIGNLDTIKVGTPVDDDDAAPKSYVDGLGGGGIPASIEDATDGGTQVLANDTAIQMDVDGTASVVIISTASLDTTVPIYGADGTAAAPAFTFETVSDSGMYYDSAGGPDSEDQVGMSVDGVDTQLWRVTDGESGNFHLAVEAGDAEILLIAEGTGDDANIRLVPKGAGTVYLGEAGAGSTISSADGFSTLPGEELYITAGSATDGDADGGSLTLRSGNADGTGTDGVVKIEDGNSNETAVFNGVDSAVNYVSITNAIATENPLISVDGADTNADLELDGKGTGLVVGPTGYDMSSGADEAFATKEYVDDKAFNVSTKTAGYTTTADDDVIFADSTGGGFTVTLGTAATLAGMQHVIKDSGGDAGANTITIATQAAQTIDGAATQTITNDYESLTIISDGTNWFIV